jgi:hypothetical protein
MTTVGRLLRPPSLILLRPVKVAQDSLVGHFHLQQVVGMALENRSRGVSGRQGQQLLKISAVNQDGIPSPAAIGGGDQSLGCRRVGVEEFI